MKQFYTVIFIIFSFNISVAQWKNATPIGSSINDIQFVNRYVGYAIATSTQIGNCSNTAPLNLYKTIDEGENWILLNTGTNSTLTAMHFVDDLHGWIAGTGTSYIRGTSDGGQTWTSFANTIATGVNDIYFSSLQNGFIIGNGGAMRKTTNGGNTWQFQASGVTVNLNKIYFYNSQLGFITCQNGQILRTSNGGSTWSAITTGATVLTDVVFTSTTLGFAVGYVSGSFSVLKTADGGTSWSIQQALYSPSYALNKIIFTNANNGYIATGGKGIYRTTDGGDTWVQNNDPGSFFSAWKSIYFVDNNIGYVCGSGGKISKTTDGGTTWKNQTSSGVGLQATVWATNKSTAYIGMSSGIIKKTKNGGLNWQQKTTSLNSQINKVYFVNDSIGFACSDSGRILKTMDAGESWVLKPTNSLRAISDFSFVNKDTGYASAAGGKVFRTLDKGETWDSVSTNSSDYFTGIYFTNYVTGFVISYNKIYRTYNAGALWTVTNTTNAGNLKDIIFTNDSLGYCAGGFGNVLFTTDAGLNWYATNANTGNAEIAEMSAVNDSIIFTACLGSQYASYDSLKQTSSESTACLSGNYNTTSIFMTDSGRYGYCVGGGMLHIKEPVVIPQTIVATNAFCAGSNIAVGFDAKGYIFDGNIFTAQLSDNTGSFASPISIGTYSSIPFVYKSGIMNCTIPANTPAGLYRIRVVGSNPVVIGADNGFDITISSQAIPAVSLQSNITGTTCTGSQFMFNANTSVGGLNPTYQWLVNGVDINNNSSVYYTDTLQNNDVVNVVMTSSLSCVSNASSASNNYTASIIPFSISVSASDTICQNSQTQLNVVGGNSFLWSPTAGLNNTTIANPLASPNTTTNYTVVATDVNGCTATENVNIVVNPIPTNFITTNDTAICIKSTLQLSTNGNFQYSWLPTGAVSNSSIANPISNAINSNTNFIAIATSPDNCVGSDTLHVSIHPQLPSPILLTNDTTLCNFQGQLQLHAQAGGVDYQWSPSVFANGSLDLNPFVNVPNSMSYYLQVTDTFGCIAKDTVNITLQSGIVLPILQMVNTTVCPNSIFFLGAFDNPHYTYQWSSTSASIPYPNISTSPIDGIIQNSTFYLTVVDTITTCSKTDSVRISLHNYQTQFPVITESNGVLNCTPAHFYQWYLDSVPLANEVYQSYTPTAEGDYYVAVNDSAVCDYYSSALYNFIFTNLSKSVRKNETIGIYPNPASNQITIYNLQSTKYSLTIQNTLGEIVFAKNNFAASETIDVSSFASGVYFVRVNDKVVKFLKK